MKTILVLSILFCAIALPALGELTDADLNQIRLIVNEAEKRIKEEVKTEITNAEKRINEHTNVKIDSLEKRLSTYNWVIYILMPLIVAAIGIPMAILAWRGSKDNDPQKQIEELRQELRQELAALKQHPALSTGAQL